MLAVFVCAGIMYMPDLLNKDLVRCKMFNVYEVCTWDDVTYTEVSSYDKEIDAKKECDRLNVERRSKKYNPDPICYCVMSDLQYYLLMKD